MTVIARLPGLDDGVPVSPAGDSGGAGAWRDEQAAPGGRGAPRPRRRRPAGPRFPALSTLILVSVAGACWAAVWWQERARVAASANDPAGPDGIAVRFDGETVGEGSVTR